MASEMHLIQRIWKPLPLFFCINQWVIMKRMKLDKTCTVCMILLLTVLLAACGRGSNQEAASEKPVDSVSEVAEAVISEPETTAMDETVQMNYKVLLDGTSDQEAVYYLMDVTGNGSPELIVGKEAMSVYSCNQGAVTTIGAMAIDTAYLSTKYGFLAFNNQNDKYELVQYKYDGEMITETVLVSASSEADYKSQADQYLADARELKAYALDDRTPFGDEAAE